MIRRYIEKFVKEDLDEKMVFIAGARQVGKTTFSRDLGKRYFGSTPLYLNWDNREDRKAILQSRFRADSKLIIFDEIHKYKGWKNYLKGEYDKHKKRFKMLVTGSARLDIYRRGGDSLMGRYHYWRLHPLSLAELLGRETKATPFSELEFENPGKEGREYLQTLFRFGGFPEMVIMQNDRALRRWHNEHVDRLVKEDIRDVENVRDLSALQVFVEILPEKVGSLFSLNSVREDLNVAHKTVASWADILERFYCHFRIYPFKSNKIKALRKEPKLYLWDWSEIKNGGIRFENLMASHLLKFCQFLYDAHGYKASLHFLRDTEQREVDFLVAVDNKPWFCVEAKMSPEQKPAGLNYFSAKLKIPFVYQVVMKSGIDNIKDGVRTVSADKFLTALI